MLKFFIYDSDGVIIERREGISKEIAVPAEQFIGDGWPNPLTHYAPGGVITPRPDYPYTINKTSVIADRQDMIEISGLIAETTVTWPDGITTNESNSISFSLDMPGEFQVRLEAFPYKTEVINVTATPAT